MDLLILIVRFVSHLTNHYPCFSAFVNLFLGRFHSNGILIKPILDRCNLSADQAMDTQNELDIQHRILKLLNVSLPVVNSLKGSKSFVSTKLLAKDFQVSLYTESLS